MDKRKVAVGDAFFTYFREATIKREDESPAEIKEELVYLGQDGHRFYVVFREFIDDRIRDPFFLKLIYENPHGSECAISFRKNRFIVHSVSNEFIEVSDLE